MNEIVSIVITRRDGSVQVITGEDTRTNKEVQVTNFYETRGEFEEARELAKSRVNEHIKTNAISR